jgi:hypothetical protein
MTQYFGIDWLAMCLTFGAIYLLGNRSRTGCIVMMSGERWAERKSELQFERVVGT